MPDDFDPEKEFEIIDNMMTKGQKDAWKTMKKVTMDLFEANSVLSNAENTAVAQDIVAHALGFRADNIVALWYTEWKIKKLEGK